MLRFAPAAVFRIFCGRRRPAPKSPARPVSSPRRTASRPTAGCRWPCSPRLASWPRPEQSRPGPAVDGAVQQAIPYVFERTAAAAVGVLFKTTPAGAVQIPRVTTAPPADTVAKDGAAPATAAVVGLVSRTPKRITGQFEVRVEDLAIYPPLEAVLQEAMRTAIGNETDEQVFNGTGSSGDLTGLFQTAAQKTADGTAETFVTGVSQFAALVDGKHAYALTDIYAIVGSKTFARYASQFRNGSDGSLADYLVSHLGMFRVSDRMPSPTNADNQKGIVTLMASGDPICIYVWDALEIVRDPFSGAGSGKVTITAACVGVGYFRPARSGPDQGNQPEGFLMRDAERFTVPCECRASEDGPTLYLLALTEGRAARGGLAEVWAPGAATWPADGIEVRTVHRPQGGPGEARADSFSGRQPRFKVAVQAPRTNSGGPSTAALVTRSVEFHSLVERKNPRRYQGNRDGRCLSASR